MLSQENELIWQGIVHMGDEPGTFSNAHYNGLTLEIPLTIQSRSGEKKQVSLKLETEYVKIFSDYKGHKITITKFVLDDSSSNPYDYKEIIILEDQLTDSNTDKVISFDMQEVQNFVSCKIEIDTKVMPGLYNDFLVKKLSFISKNNDYYANIGFR